MKRSVASRRLVVDANVLRSASNTDEARPPGSDCRAVLEAIYRICHRAVVSPALRAEYERHASKYGVRWLEAMASKGKLEDGEARTTSRARGWMQSAALSSEREREELRKDLHLVLAALETDHVVVSSETKVRGLLERVLGDADPALGWALVGPTTVAWLEAGAPLTAEITVPHVPGPAHQGRRNSSIPKPKAR
ncbi:MAG: hypothetical protein OHK0013_32680 [Sandaracinaceae bacterium]